MKYNLADLFEAVVAAHPARAALYADPVRHTFKDFDEAANRIGHVLRSHGVQPGDHVGVYAYNRAEWMETMIGCLKIRAVPINVNYRYVTDELAYIFDNADLRALVFERGFAPRIGEVRDKVPQMDVLIALGDGSDEDVDGLGAISYGEAIAEASPDRDFEPRSPDDRYIIYTGGTTGLPKGVMWRQEDIYFAFCGGIDFYTGEPVQSPQAAAEKAAANETPLVFLACAPLMHGAAQVGSLGQLLGGNTCVLYTGRSFDADRIWQLIESERVNVMSITGDAMARPLVESLERGGYDISSLAAVSSSAAIFSPSVKQRFMELVPNAVFTDAIGSTESGYNGLGMAQKGERTRGVKVTPGADATVLEEGTWEPVEPGSGVIGRLARTGNIPLGYYNDPKKTAETFIEAHGKRWAVPGDYATVEEDGSIVLLGRGSQCINTGGEKVFPEEVEGAVKSHPGVYDCVVVGAPDERWGERVVAVVQPRQGKQPTLDEIQEHCRAQIAGYKLPRELHLVDAVARQPSGKPDYPWAKELVKSATASSP